MCVSIYTHIHFFLSTKHGLHAICTPQKCTKMNLVLDDSDICSSHDAEHCCPRAVSRGWETAVDFIVAVMNVGTGCMVCARRMCRMSGVPVAVHIRLFQLYGIRSRCR